MQSITFPLILLLIAQYLDNSYSTRLPLEVYELTPAAADAATHLQQPTQQQQQQAIDLKHKKLEYTTFVAKELAEKEQQQQQQQQQLQNLNVAGAVASSGSSSSSSTNSSSSSTTRPKTTTTTADLTVVSISAEEQQQDATKLAAIDTLAEHRRSRQMSQGHRFEPGFLHLQQVKQQQQLLLNEHSSSSSSNTKHIHNKNVRVLYQVGDSEEDLPICAPNAVCSKIDLYETPWIERQCRCPESNRMPNVIIHHHHQLQLQQQQQQHHHPETINLNTNNDKYRNYFEKEKLLQHKRLLLGDYNDKKYENMHLKKLMQKLGAVYEDELQLQPSDYLEQEYNDALPTVLEQEFDDINDNEFPHGPPPPPPAASSRHLPIVAYGATTTHMRHSGHRGAKEPQTFIGGCPSSLGIEDGHTIADKTRHYKLCQPVHKLPVCKHFRDYTWTLTTAADLNVTEQIVHCRCPRNSVTYLTKREPAGTNGYTYLFACSPLTRIRCQRKQPCKLFTVRKRQEFLDEVNINSLCQCPKGHHCPSHHTQSSVIAGESFLEDNIQTYSGYCMAND